MDPSSECAIRRGRARWLSSLSRLFYPLTCYRIYNIKYSKFMGSGCFLEMGIYFLHQDRFGL